MPQQTLSQKIQALINALDLSTARIAGKGIVGAVFGAVPNNFPRVPHTPDWSDEQSYYENVIDNDCTFEELHQWALDCQAGEPWS